MKQAYRIFLLLLVIWGGVGELHAEPLYFVHISDTHIGAGGTAATRAAIASIHALPMPVACVVHTGDITGDALGRPKTVAFTSQLLGQLKPPLLMVPGNHDILKEDVATTLSAYTNTFGRLIESHQIGPLRFITVYTEPLAHNVPVPGYSPLTELERMLEQAPRTPTIICHHSPSIRDFYNNSFHRGWPDKQAAAWRTLLNRYNVKAILCGHYHRSEQHWVGDIPLYVGPAIVDYWGRTPSYRIYAYENDRLSYYSVYLPLPEKKTK